LDELRRVRKALPEQSGAKPRLEPHHRQILAYIEEHGSITQREYGQISSRSLASRKLDFDKLLKMGLIETKGTGRGTYYVRVS
jgi:predicted HTH transcriptional regulator